MSLNLTGTSYITNTDQLLPVADDRSWIESADDPKEPTTSALSFDELEANAVAGGAGSEAEKVRDDVIATISAVVLSAEKWVESFGQEIYALPYTPADSYIVELALDYAWHRMMVRRSMYKDLNDRLTFERSLVTRGTRVRDRLQRLSSALVPENEGAREAVYAFGGTPRRNNEGYAPEE